MGRILCAFLGFAVLAGLIIAPSAAADDTAVIARNLAENILGRGVVRVSRVIEDGRTVNMIWESATYKPANPLAHTRDLLQVEASFASASIFRVLTRVENLQFEIVLGKRWLCTGRVTRGQPMRITYAKDLGG